MKFSWDYWPRRWAYNAPAAQQQRHNHGQLVRLNQQLNEKDAELRDLSEGCFTLQRHISNLEQQHLADSEKDQRQKQLLQEARDQLSRAKAEHQQEISVLYTKLNSLQTSQKRLTDEQVQAEMRLLAQNLEAWIKSNFRDSSRLASCIGPADFPSTSPQRRAWVQASILYWVFKCIFGPYRFGVVDEPHGHFLVDIEAGVKRTNSEATFHTWKAATGCAVEQIAAEFQDGIFMHIIDNVESQFSEGSTTEPETRTGQLWKFLARCSAFKETLSRAPESFIFHCSAAGVDFSEAHMTSVGADGESCLVRLSLWPGLYKGGPDLGYQVLEPEVVWAMEEVQL
ncbi:hypothetical protein BJX70DRAFT_394710 [Aspergillus crustosus]